MRKNSILSNRKFLVPFLLFFSFMYFFSNLLSASAYGDPIQSDNFVLSRSKVDRQINLGDIFTDNFEITNLKNQELKFSLTYSNELSEILSFSESSLSIAIGNKSVLNFLIEGKKIGNYSGFIEFKGDLSEKIPVSILVLNNEFDPPVIISNRFTKKRFVKSGTLDFELNIQKLKPTEIYHANFSYVLYSENNKSYFLGNDTLNITNSFQIFKSFKFPDSASTGIYYLETTLIYEDFPIAIKSPFVLKIAFLHIKLFGFLPVWILVFFICAVIFGLLVYYLINKRIEKRKKYRMQLDLKSLPVKTPGFFYLGKIAETNHNSYLDPLRLMTHSIIAGATGGGKSISAQVIIEEALLNNIAVIVFDPTAQWSGMLRKCTDKKMLSYYPKFGLKEGEARAFKGNVRQIKDARQVIDIKKHMNPGQIQIFSLNKLKPQEMDIFVANVVREIFNSDPQEAPNLKLILVFDEVHRLLAKFGGSGEGFLQIERACREFRKWGMGVMLVSSIVADFVGEIKANISTEAQMRTRDEGDLNRIKTKYGEEFLQSLVKASVGVGMFVNPAYNHAKPYFINFRPILHNTRRLSDEELEKYNNYNDILDDLEYQIQQLEKEKLDVFDFNMELKLMKDKLMTGNFAVVEIYLEGLKPRIEKEWQKLGKKPKKQELKLIAEDEIKKSIEEAKKSRQIFEKEEAKKVEKEKKEEKKENIDDKILQPLTFDNGIMVSSLKELKDYLPNMEREIFKTHVNNKKNDIERWIKENIPGEETKIVGVKTKEEMIKALADIGKEPKEELVKVKKDEKQEMPTKKEEKK